MSASPPVPHGVPYPASRGPTPQPSHLAAPRPHSSNDGRRPSSNLTSQYLPAGMQPLMYPSRSDSGQLQLQLQPQPQPQPQPARHASPLSYPAPSQQLAQPQSQHPPPLHRHFLDQHRPPNGPAERRMSPPQASTERSATPTLTLSLSSTESAAHGPERPVKRLSVKSRSIFTPIDESRSILSQHWAASAKPTTPAPPRAQYGPTADDLGHRDTPVPPPAASRAHARSVSAASAPSDTASTPPARPGSAQSNARRPRLKVQIPDELDEDCDNSSAPETESSGHRQAEPTQPGSVVLPAPSPSASAVLSAGATGPRNPFARPHPPAAARDVNETPASALPSRFMASDFLPSPNTFFYPEWTDRSNTLPSPLSFATPTGSYYTGFGRDEGIKRKSPDMMQSSEDKRPKVEAQG
jgi:MADS-box transcription factor